MSTLRTRPRRRERLETRPGPTDPGLAPPIDARGVRVESHAGFGRPVVVGVDGSDASLRAVKVAVRLLGDSGDLILICATRRRRKEASTTLHDALKDESYLLSGQAGVDETLRTAAELARWHGARTVSTMSEVGDPTTVLHRAAGRVEAGLDRPTSRRTTRRRRHPDRHRRVGPSAPTGGAGRRCPRHHLGLPLAGARTATRVATAA